MLAIVFSGNTEIMFAMEKAMNGGNAYACPAITDAIIACGCQRSRKVGRVMKCNHLEWQIGDRINSTAKVCKNDTFNAILLS